MYSTGAKSIHGGNNSSEILDQPPVRLQSGNLTKATD
jgi:hypothetical protein